MKKTYLPKEVVTRMTNTHMTLGKWRVRQLLANIQNRLYQRINILLWDEEAMESDLGSDYIVEELLEEVHKERIRLEHLLGFDKEKVVEPD